MSIRIYARYSGPSGSSREMRESAFWRATAVCIAINDFESSNPIPLNASSLDPTRAEKLRQAVSLKLKEYGVIRGPRWWQRGVGTWRQEPSTRPKSVKVCFAGWDKGYNSWLTVELENVSAPTFEVRREDYGLES